MLAEEKRKQEILRKMADAGPFDVFDENGNLITGKEKKKKGKGDGEKIKKGKKKEAKGKKKGVKGKKTKKKGDKGKKGKKAKKGKKGKKEKGKSKKKPKKENETEYMGFKSGKAGQLGPGWTHFIGMQLMLKVWALAEAPPDEVFLSRASAYFDVQANALLQFISSALDCPVPNQNKVTPQDTKMVLGCLNLAVWIAQNVTRPAQAIVDSDVAKLLPLRGGELVIKKKKEKPKKGKKKQEKEEEDSEKDHGFMEMDTNSPVRKWTEQEFPFVKPMRLGRERASTLPDVMSVPSRISVRSFVDDPTSSSPVRFSSSAAESPNSVRRSSDNSEFDFLRTAKWYDPCAPEFMYDGPHISPKGVEFVNMNGESMWQLSSVPDMTPQPLAPEPVPQYFFHLRPRVHQGGSGPVGGGPGPWYVMSDPSCYWEKPSLWASPSAIEQIEMVFDIVHTMITIPELSMSRFLELVAELSESIKLSEQNEELDSETQLLDQKRTIILEKMFLEFFDSKFRDFNSDTADYMRVICHRGAVLVRHLYEHTAWMLWKLQQYHEPEPSPPPELEEEGEPEDDPMALAKWDAWLEFLTKASDSAREWQLWLQDALEGDSLPDDRTQLIQEAEKWLNVGQDTLLKAEEFAVGAPSLPPIFHRPINESGWTEVGSEDGEWVSDE